MSGLTPVVRKPRWAVAARVALGCVLAVLVVTLSFASKKGLSATEIITEETPVAVDNDVVAHCRFIVEHELACLLVHHAHELPFDLLVQAFRFEVALLNPLE